jgi:hypothetical protein
MRFLRIPASFVLLDGTPDTSQPGCAQYGQTCTTAAECCNGIPCSSGRCLEQIIL